MYLYVYDTYQNLSKYQTEYVNNFEQQYTFPVPVKASRVKGKHNCAVSTLTYS